MNSHRVLKIIMMVTHLIELFLSKYIFQDEESEGYEKNKHKWEAESSGRRLHRPQNSHAQQLDKRE